MGTQLKQRPIAMQDPISKELGRQASQSTPVPKGSIAKIAQKYDPRNSTRLLGMLLKFDFDASHIITCDPWKRNCGGIPRGAFIILRLDPEGVEPEDAGYSQRLTLARVLEEAPTPIDAQTQQTLFQIHKMQAQMDPLTHKDLQWSGLKASVLGTFYDYEGEIAFGNDVDTFFAPLSYVAFMPSAEDLDQLINAFVDPAKAVEIGNLRYTETLPLKRVDVVPIKINPEDLVGSLNSAQRTANFGKTRFGKSNTTKIFAQALFHTKPDVGQLFIDTSGEYTHKQPRRHQSLLPQQKACRPLRPRWSATTKGTNRSWPGSAFSSRDQLLQPARRWPLSNHYAVG